MLSLALIIMAACSKVTPTPEPGKIILDSTFSPKRVQVSSDSPEVYVQAADGTNVKVRITQFGGAQGEFQVATKTEDDILDVEATTTPCNGTCAGRLQIAIGLPAAMQINVQTSSGNVTMDRVAGPKVIATERGSMTFTNSPGQYFLDTDSGKISIASAGDGILTVGSESGSLDFQGTLGKGGANSIETDSGNVRLRLPGNSVFDLQTGSNSGALRNDFKDVKPVPDDDLITLRITTDSGGISIEKQ